MKQSFNFSFINLGCTKNLVDSQMLMGRIFDIGINNPHYNINYFTDPFDSKVKFVFLNTCGFISTGREEMMNMITKLTQANKTIYLIGCGLQYYKTMLPKTFDVMKFKKFKKLFFLSRNDFDRVTITKLIAGYNSKTFSDFEFSTTPRVYTNIDQKFEYLKIAEGCDNKCTFCIIPRLRGKQKSLPIQQIIKEVKNMIHTGIKEIILIAQDTARYGMDLYHGKPMLIHLLKKIDLLPGDFTYRLLYLYPDVITQEHIHQMKNLKKFIPYFDIPLQHISSSVLKRMGRFYEERSITSLLNTIKKDFPVNFIRTNLIIGFPGETKKDFMKLKKFVQKQTFDNIALFEYHDEPFAASSKLDKKVPDAEIRKRFLEIKKIVDQLLDRQEKVRKKQEDIGYIMDIKQIKEERGKMKDELVKLVVRPWLHAPEIDSYDEITIKQVIGTFENKNELAIGDKIIYTV